MSSLRRRFQQNQEDCTITVLELLPTVAENVIEALPAERISKEIQQKKAEKTGKSAATSDIAPSDFSSGTPSAADEDGKSASSFQSESYVHASQMGKSSSELRGDRPPKTKAQLWNDLKLTGAYLLYAPLSFTADCLSYYSSIHSHLYLDPSNTPHANPIEPPWEEKLSCECGITRQPIPK